MPETSAFNREQVAWPSVNSKSQTALLTCYPSPRAKVVSGAVLVMTLGAGAYLFAMYGDIDAGICDETMFEGFMVCPVINLTLYGLLIAIFVIGTPVALRLLLRSMKRDDPTLVAGPEGLWLWQAGRLAGPVLWETVAGIRRVRGTFGERLGIELTDPTATLPALGLPAGTGVTWASRHGGAALTLSAAWLDMPLDELCHTLRGFQEQHS